MIRHLLKLVWNRKRTNALVIIEIFCSFLVLFTVLTVGSGLILNYTKPLGFDWQNVWDVDITGSVELDDSPAPENAARLQRMMREVRSMPQVIAVAGSATPPYSFSSREGGWNINGKKIRITFDAVTDDFIHVAKLRLVRGRWFRPEDDALSYRPVVIDQNMARALFGDKDPVGETFDGTRGALREPDGSGEDRVVGVVANYRKDGELSRPLNFVFQRVATNGAYGRPPQNLVIRLQPGTPAEFEEVLQKRLQAVAGETSFRIRHMDQMRTKALKTRLAPIVAGSIIGLFLVLMVALGLTGVLWQNVTRRTGEIGLRRALGASARAVRRQILSEVAVLATLAMIAGVVVVSQLPLLGVFSWLQPGAFALGMVVALTAIYAITLMCGLYPSWLASRVQPAAALHND